MLILTCQYWVGFDSLMFLIITGHIFLLLCVPKMFFKFILKKFHCKIHLTVKRQSSKFLLTFGEEFYSSTFDELCVLESSKFMSLASNSALSYWLTYPIAYLSNSLEFVAVSPWTCSNHSHSCLPHFSEWHHHYIIAQIFSHYWSCHFSASCPPSIFSPLASTSGNFLLDATQSDFYLIECWIFLFCSGL